MKLDMREPPRKDLNGLRNVDEHDRPASRPDAYLRDLQTPDSGMPEIAAPKLNIRTFGQGTIDACRAICKGRLASRFHLKTERGHKTAVEDMLYQRAAKMSSAAHAL